jgi:hypothetical protein
MRFWETEVRSNTAKIAGRIERAVHRCRGTHVTPRSTR